MKLTTDIIINSIKNSLLEISLYPIDSLRKYKKLYYKKSKREILNMSTNELYELTDLIFTQQSISVNQQTTKSTDRIFVPKIGTLVRNPIYNDILIAAGNNPEITQDEIKDIIKSHIERIKLLETKNQVIDISNRTIYGKTYGEIDT